MKKHHPPRKGAWRADFPPPRREPMIEVHRSQIQEIMEQTFYRSAGHDVVRL
jgi:hypothetical protein